VLGHVGQQLGGAEVSDGLDRGRRAFRQVDGQLDGQVAASVMPPSFFTASPSFMETATI
jgi:hypothetical protein